MKIIKLGQDARDALKRGIDLAADAVECTLGPSGRNAIIGRMDITPIITNDGVTILRNLEVEDETEQLAVMVAKEAASLTDNEAGDGTTTTTTLLRAIVNELFDAIKDDGTLVKKKVDTIKLKKDLDHWCGVVCNKLQEMAKPISKKDLYDVAMVSAEYDWLAKIVASVFEKVGKDGYVSVEEGMKTDFEIFKGIEIDVGLSSDYFINNDKGECVIDKPYVLVTNHVIDTGMMETIVSLIADLIQQEKVSNLVIIAPDFSRDILSRFITTKIKTNFGVVALKLPHFGKDDLYLDICALLNCNLIDKNTFIKSDDFKLAFHKNNAGIGEKIVVGSAKTLIVGNGDTKERVKKLKKTLSETISVFDRDAIEKRIAYLSGGVGIIRISGNSDFEKGYMKLKAEDCVNAVQAALNYGVVKGGGLALKSISESFEKPNILSKPLLKPYQCIQANAGGFLKIEDNIVDPVKVTISAVKSACSLAGTLITTEVSIAYKNESNKRKNENEN